MAISYPVSLPSTPSFRSFLQAGNNTVGSRFSEFTHAGQFFKWQGEFWAAEVELPLMVRADADEWIAFLLSLRGMSGTFYLGDTSKTSPRGTASGVTVNGASQTGENIILAGSGTLKKGDHLQIGSGTTQRLYCCLEDVTL